jgi:predicted nucleic acid-binding protein
MTKSPTTRGLSLSWQHARVITDIVYCEFSVGMTNQAEVDAAISTLALERYPGNDTMLFRAGKAFQQYRKKHKGPKTNVLPDFLIGAAAEVADAPLVTANAKDFRTYFPGVTLIQP